MGGVGDGMGDERGVSGGGEYPIVGDKECIEEGGDEGLRLGSFSKSVGFVISDIA